jgi:hypothetical protein
MLRNLNKEIRGKAKLVYTWQERQSLTFLQSPKIDLLINSQQLARVALQQTQNGSHCLDTRLWFWARIWQSIASK